MLLVHNLTLTMRLFTLKPTTPSRHHGLDFKPQPESIGLLLSPLWPGGVDIQLREAEILSLRQGRMPWDGLGTENR